MLKIGIAGASGSGKTHLTRALESILTEKIPQSDILVITEDQYYRDQTQVPMPQREVTNYDHPQSLEHELLIEQIQCLCEGNSVELPIYDYNIHTRKSETMAAKPPAVLIVEGILLFSQPALVAHFDASIFLDTPLDICLLRRIRRDVEERGRTVESILTQWEATVRPMYKTFVEPSREKADLIIPFGTDSEVRTRLLSGLVTGLV